MVNGSPPLAIDALRPSFSAPPFGVAAAPEVEEAVGETDRVVGGLTAIESLVWADEAAEAAEFVLKVNAANLGRAADDAGAGGCAFPVLLILAASWLRDGRRPPVRGLAEEDEEDEGGAGVADDDGGGVASDGVLAVEVIVEGAVYDDKER